MDFARRQLEKYGWTDGKGLGKNENGIAEALKPKLKRSVTGIGHDAASDFTEHWWSALYNKAAENIKVENKNGKTKKIKTNDESDFEISCSMWKIKKKRKTTDSKIEQNYSDFFVKKAVLANGGSRTQKLKDSDSEDDKEIKDVLKMTDEELFAACGGRTAHKGARHGLRALGKLERIKQQEEELLNLPQYEGYSHSKNKKKSKSSTVETKVVENTNLYSDTDATAEVKKKKKKRKRCSSHEIVDCKVTELGNTNDMKVNNTDKHVSDPNLYSDTDATAEVKKKKKKRKRCSSHGIVEDTKLETTYDMKENETVKCASEKIKKQKKRLEGNVASDSQDSVCCRNLKKFNKNKVPGDELNEEEVVTKCTKKEKRKYETEV